MSITAGEWATLFETALKERAEIETRCSTEGGFEPLVVEPFFPGFKVLKPGCDARYYPSWGGWPSMEETFADARPVEHLLAAVRRAGLSVAYERKPKSNWASLFGRREINVHRFYEGKPFEVFFNVAHELAHFVLHRRRPRRKDPILLERETAILEWYIMRLCAEDIHPIRVDVRKQFPESDRDPLIPPPLPERVRTKREMLRSRDRLMIGAAMIEDLFCK